MFSTFQLHFKASLMEKKRVTKAQHVINFGHSDVTFGAFVYVLVPIFCIYYYLYLF